MQRVAVKVLHVAAVGNEYIKAISMTNALDGNRRTFDFSFFCKSAKIALLGGGGNVALFGACGQVVLLRSPDRFVLLA